MSHSDHIPWPRSPPREDLTSPPRVGIVVATFNTRRLSGQLIFPLYWLLGCQEFEQMADDASPDGSAELLTALHDAGLLHLTPRPAASPRYPMPFCGDRGPAAVPMTCTP